ncbi:MAG TPA: hypothetical protein VNT42_08780 [Sphingomonas sp.]|nr:hypothetical protein [Sphingomonas sp.]
MTGAIIHHVAAPTVDVAKIRAGTGLPQGAFARTIGVAKGTLLNWEQWPPPDRPRLATARHDRAESPRW